MPGVPDVVLCDERGYFHFVELKATAGNAVDLRPHQVAWLSNHGHGSVWVLVKKLKTKNQPEKKQKNLENQNHGRISLFRSLHTEIQIRTFICVYVKQQKQGQGFGTTSAAPVPLVASPGTFICQDRLRICGN